MRGLLGVIVLILGIAGLAYWGSRHQAEEMQTEISDAASQKIANSIHGVTTEVKGRDIILSGLADSESERDQLVAELNEVPGRRVVRDETTILEKADPYSFNATKDQNGITIDSGNYPLKSALATYDGVNGADKLVMASGAPDNWAGATKDSLGALNELIEGKLAIQNQTITLTGSALTGEQRDGALASLSGLNGYTAEGSIKVLDDGKPAEFVLTWDAGSGGTINGKLPKGLTTEDLAAALGSDRLTGEAYTALVGDDGLGANVPADLGALKPWLPQVETAKYTWTEQSKSLEAQLTPGGNARLVRIALEKELPDTDIKVTAAPADTTVADKTERINAATGQTEQYVDGFWLPKVDFDPTLANCTKQTEDALAKNKINFLSGSANLDANAVLAINNVAAVVRRCTIDGHLKAELGGHTDNVGNPATNLALSRARANAVRLALMSRGVSAFSLTATGYGQGDPIADNSTEEGRAKNRRTTITWMAN